MTKIKRGGYVFLNWIGDHAPSHVHIYREGNLVLKWDLENNKPMVGKASRKLLQLISDLRTEGKL